MSGNGKTDGWNLQKADKARVAARVSDAISPAVAAALERHRARMEQRKAGADGNDDHLDDAEMYRSPYNSPDEIGLDWDEDPVAETNGKRKPKATPA